MSGRLTGAWLGRRHLSGCDAQAFFDGRPVITAPSPRSAEDCILIAIAWMWRGCAIRMITMRKARDGEKKRYQALYG